MPERRLCRADEPRQAGARRRTGGIPQFLVELARNAPAMMWVFTATTFLSALLLFADPADVRQDGAAGARRLAVGVGGVGVLLPGRAAGRLLLRPPADQQGAAASDRPHPSGRVRRGLRAACRSACSSGWGEPPPGEPYLWQLGMFTVVDRPAVHGRVGQCAAAAGVVRPHRPSATRATPTSCTRRATSAA